MTVLPTEAEVCNYLLFAEIDKLPKPKIRHLEYELAEARSELLRHHRDFGRIDGILDAALDFKTLDADEALRQIRAIVQ